MGEQLATRTDTRQGAGTRGFRTLGLQPWPGQAELPSGEGWSERPRLCSGAHHAPQEAARPVVPWFSEILWFSCWCCNGIIPLNCEKWKCSTLSRFRLFVIPRAVAPSGSSVHGILQARILVWVAIPFSTGSFWPRDQTHVSCVAGRFFTIGAPGQLCVWNKDCFGKVIKSVDSLLC